MLLTNTSNQPFTVRLSGGRAVTLAPLALTPVPDGDIDAVRVFLKTKMGQSLTDTGFLRVGDDAADPETTAETLTKPEAPNDLTVPAEKSGRRARVEKLEKAGEVTL